MALDVVGIIDKMIEERDFERLMNDPARQFGTKTKAYLGATILPEQPKEENVYEEAGIRYRSIVANDGTRYSPVQLKSGMMVGSFEVRLGYQDTGSQMTGKDYDTFARLLKAANNTTDAPAMQAIGSVLRWADTQLNIPMREVIEKQRWQAIELAQVTRQGDNGYREIVSMSNPSGHRVASDDWTDDAVDPYDDLIGRADLLRDKGYTPGRIICGWTAFSLFARHPLIRQRLGITSIISGNVVGLRARATVAEVNSMLAADGLPAFEIYDLQYQTATGSEYFLSRDVMVMIATTGRDEEIWLGPDTAPVVMENTLGYVGIGVPVGADGPGREVRTEFYNGKPPHIEGSTWQASFPVIAEPEAIAVLTDIPV